MMRAITLWPTNKARCSQAVWLCPVGQCGQRAVALPLLTQAVPMLSSQMAATPLMQADSRMASVPAANGAMQAPAGSSKELAAGAAQAWAARRQTLAMRMVIAAELLHILRPLVYTMALRR